MVQYGFFSEGTGEPQKALEERRRVTVCYELLEVALDAKWRWGGGRHVGREPLKDSEMQSWGPPGRVSGMGKGKSGQASENTFGLWLCLTGLFSGKTLPQIGDQPPPAPTGWFLADALWGFGISVYTVSLPGVGHELVFS